MYPCTQVVAYLTEKIGVTEFGTKNSSCHVALHASHIGLLMNPT